MVGNGKPDWRATKPRYQQERSLAVLNTTRRLRIKCKKHVTPPSSRPIFGWYQHSSIRLRRYSVITGLSRGSGKLERVYLCKRHGAGLSGNTSNRRRKTQLLPDLVQTRLEVREPKGSISKCECLSRRKLDSCHG